MNLCVTRDQMRSPTTLYTQSQHCCTDQVFCHLNVNVVDSFITLAVKAITKNLVMGGSPLSSLRLIPFSCLISPFTPFSLLKSRQGLGSVDVFRAQGPCLVAAMSRYFCCTLQRHCSHSDDCVTMMFKIMTIRRQHTTVTLVHCV